MAAPSLRRHLLFARAARMLKRERADDGAAAVEFALVLPILVLILFGIIDYGLWFSNSLDSRSGLEAATRRAVVANFANCTKPTDVVGSPSDHVLQIMCMVKDATGAVTGETYVKVVLPTDPANPSNPPGWIVDQPLTVCQMIVVKGVTGYVPLPRGGVIRAQSVMQIEQDTGQPETGGEEVLPSGLNWSWCGS
jgi:Flp pilus assembly protein TadG